MFIALTKQTSSSKWMLLTFQELVKSHKDVALLYLATPDKTFYGYPETTHAADYDPTTRPWYINAIEKNAIVWTEPYVATSSKKMTITIAKPVYNSFNKNELVGVIAMDIASDTLSNKISAITIGKNGYPIILDSKGTVVTNKDATKVCKPFTVTTINTVKIMKEVKVISSDQSQAVEDVNSSFELISKSVKDIISNIKSVSNLVNHINADKDSIVDAIQNIYAISEETAADSFDLYYVDYQTL